LQRAQAAGARGVLRLGWLTDGVPRLALLSGSRIPAVSLPDDAVVLRPPPPLDPIADVAAAVDEALRYPLSGPPLEELAAPGNRVTVVVAPPLLPLPGAPQDPRQEALAAVIAALERVGVASERQTILVAGGLEQRAGQRDLDALLHPARARQFHGSVVVHDCESTDLRRLGEAAGIELRVSPALLDADLVVVVSAAETVLDGGPAVLLGGCDAAPARLASADSLLQTSTSPGWELALALERLLTSRAPLLGLSLVLDHPHVTGRFRGYPHDPAADERTVRAPTRRVLNSLPAGVRRWLLQGASRELHAAAAFAGPPSVAHAEALLRGIALRAAGVERPLDALVVPLPWKSPHQPREPLNPVTAAAVGLGLALRLWRDAFPLVEGGTVVLLHSFSRAFGNGPGAPYRWLFHALRDSREPDDVAASERLAATDERALTAYRAGQAPHPLLPYVDWDGCEPALRRIGRVIVAGCRDAGAARALGFVPTHSPATALEMAYGVADGRARVGVMLAPPYVPLLVGSEAPGAAAPTA
jgi:hypothetical protein